MPAFNRVLADRVHSRSYLFWLSSNTASPDLTIGLHIFQLCTWCRILSNSYSNFFAYCSPSFRFCFRLGSWFNKQWSPPLVWLGIWQAHFSSSLRHPPLDANCLGSFCKLSPSAVVSVNTTSLHSRTSPNCSSNDCRLLEKKIFCDIKSMLGKCRSSTLASA